MSNQNNTVGVPAFCIDSIVAIILLIEYLLLYIMYFVNYVDC